MNNVEDGKFCPFFHQGLEIPIRYHFAMSINLISRGQLKFNQISIYESTLLMLSQMIIVDDGNT